MTPEECEARAIEVLSVDYTDEGVATWLYLGKNKLLDDEVPIQLIWRGEGERVLQIIGAMQVGGL